MARNRQIRSGPSDAWRDYAWPGAKTKRCLARRRATYSGVAGALGQYRFGDYGPLDTGRPGPDLHDRHDPLDCDPNDRDRNENLPSESHDLVVAITGKRRPKP